MARALDVLALDVVAALNAIAWRDWPAERITRNLDAIRGADIEALKRAE